MSIQNAISIAIGRYDVPEPYLDLYHRTLDAFKEGFEDYYKKFVLDLPTLDEQWEAYLVTPVEWLVHEDYITDKITAKDEDGNEYNLCHMMLMDYHHRSEFIDSDDFKWVFQDWLEVGKVTEEIVNQWKWRLIENKIGSVTLDW